MSDLSPIGFGNVNPLGPRAPLDRLASPQHTENGRHTPAHGRADQPGDATARADRVELSDRARLAPEFTSRLGDDAHVKRIAEIRQAIAQGTYETQEKLATAIERLLSKLAPHGDQ
jgi:negative regulator of flagellin synthesis FlgM